MTTTATVSTSPTARSSEEGAEQRETFRPVGCRAPASYRSTAGHHTLLLVGALLIIAAAVAAAALMSAGRFLAADQPALRLWYGAFLGLLGLGAGASAVRRLRAVVQSPRGAVEPMPVSFRAVADDPDGSRYSTLVEAARRRLRPIGYAQASATETATIFERSRWGRYGSSISHLGFAVLLIGGFLTALGGLSKEIVIREGETIVLPGSSVRLTLDKFSVIPYPGQSQPKEYVSRLRVIRQGAQLEWVELGVNEPAVIDGARLYQMRYSQSVERVWLVAQRNGASGQTVELVPGQRMALPDGSGWVAALEVVPDFVMDSGGSVTSRSPRFDNPAVYVAVYDQMDAVEASATAWAFRGFEAPHRDGDGGWRFQIDRLHIRRQSGIKVVRDPGVGVAYAGLALLVAGVFLAGYGAHRQVIVRRVEGAMGHAVEMQVNGVSPIAAEREFGWTHRVAGETPCS